MSQETKNKIKRLIAEFISVVLIAYILSAKKLAKQMEQGMSFDLAIRDTPFLMLAFIIVYYASSRMISVIWRKLFPKKDKPQ